MIYGIERMDGPSQPEIVPPDGITDKEAQIQKETTEAAELFDLLGPIGAARTISERQNILKEETAELARKVKLEGKDGLTGLDQRRRFDEELNRRIQLAHRTGEAVSLIFLDVNNLKKTNDKYGHQAGDLLLVGVVKKLQGALRQTDLLYRYGGDEFTILIDADEAGAVEVGLRLNEVLTESGIKLTDGKEIKASAAIGIHSSRPKDKRLSAEELIDIADKTMYVGKRENRVAVFVDNTHKKTKIDSLLTQRGLNTSRIAWVTPTVD